MIFDFFVNPDKDDWGTWDEKMNQSWTPNANSAYFEIFIPKIDLLIKISVSAFLRYRQLKYKNVVANHKK